MAPHDGLVHPEEYDIKDSNVELIGSDIDHKVKYNSAVSEPAWNDGEVGITHGLHIWRIEDFEVVPWPKEKYGQFMDGDSYIILYSYKIGKDGEEDEEGRPRLGHDIFFWLGAHTSQDEAGTAAYKTVELDEFLHGAATQHREVQASPSDAFMELFPKMQIRSGGVRSGFRHVEEEGPKEDVLTLLRVFKHPGSKRDSVVVHEVPPTWESLDEEDVFVLDKGDKIFVWQGRSCSPMEKAKAAQVVHDMTIAKHVDVEVLSQTESRSRMVVSMLGGDGDAAAPAAEAYHRARPVTSRTAEGGGREKRLLRLSDKSGRLSFGQVKQGDSISRSDLDGNDVFVLDDGGRAIWVWQGAGASAAEKTMWLKAAQAYVRQLQGGEDKDAYLIPIAKVIQGNESPTFLRAIAA